MLENEDGNNNAHEWRGQYQQYDRAREMMLGGAPTVEVMMSSEFKKVYADAYIIYGLLHALYLTHSAEGLDKLLHKYLDEKLYWVCPRV